MDKEQFIKNWPEKRERLQQRYPELTEQDLEYLLGKKDELVERVGQRLGTSRKETRDIIRGI